MIEHNGEALDSSESGFSVFTSFGRMDIIGEDDDIKMFCVDDGVFPVTMSGTGGGTMDYTLQFFDGNDNLLDERNFSDVPITDETVITTDTGRDGPTALKVDKDGDGTVDEVIYPDSYDVPKYTVTFDSQGGDAVSPASVTDGSKITPPAPPAKSGYTFGGWYKESYCLTEWNFAADAVTGNITLYAKWTADPVRYTVTFDSQGGSAVPQQTAAYGSRITPPTPPTKSGYTFKRWYREAACLNAWNFGSDIVTGSITLYAGWIDNGGGKDMIVVPGEIGEDSAGGCSATGFGTLGALALAAFFTSKKRR